MRSLAPALALAISALALAGPVQGEDPPEAPARAEFVVTLFHFNIQYVAGRNASEDAIVRESFEPLLRLYEAHPDWGADFEMQAYMIEVLARRHPAVLERFVRLVRSRQVDLVCCHYSDQLVLAYPREDLDRSVAISDRLLARHGLARAGVVFFQEGQTGSGLLAFLRERGYPIAVHARGTYDYFQPGDDHPLLYDDGGTLVLPTGSDRIGAPAHLAWGRLGDGELVVAEGNPYDLKGKLAFSEERYRGFEENLASRARRGARLVTITRYVEEMGRLGVKASPIRPYLDTPWKGENGENVYCWLGRQAAPYERDVEIASRNYELSRRARAVEILLEDNGRRGDAMPAGAEARLERAWKYLLLAEVSDAAGWLPIPNEVAYAALMQQRCEQELAALVKDGLAARGWTSAEVSLAEGRVRPASPPEPEPPVGTPPEGLAVNAVAGSRALATRWRTVAPGRWRLEVDVEVSDSQWHGVSVAFPLRGTETVYSPAGWDDRIVRVRHDAHGATRWHLALANGLVGIGDGWYVVKHNRNNHVACRVDAAAGSISFVTEGASPGRRTWRFDLVRGADEDGLAAARDLNTMPVVRLTTE